MNFTEAFTTDTSAPAPFSNDPELQAAIGADFQILLAQVTAALPQPVQLPDNVVCLATYKARLQI